MSRKTLQWMFSLIVLCSMVFGLAMPAGAATARSDAPAKQAITTRLTGLQANALQPSATTVFFSDFEADNGGFTAGGTNSSWTWGVPTSGPSAAYSGSKLWATNLAGNYNNSENSYIVSPTIDLSAYFGNNVVVAWWQWINTENAFDTVFVDVTNDGGTTWYQLYYFSGSATGWAQESFTLDPIFITAGFAIRFRMESDPDTVYEGFYVDDVAVNVEQVSTPILFWLPLISKNP